ncbi:transporter substrate-binding domain-containing protein [Streptomyces sp. NPDC052701]|uniref:transporter substrate-binding domain-containing protein n=1 Tax=Streptomyces sp. NPDC052701 TaxID=3155533 RepID=UPI00343F768D
MTDDERGRSTPVKRWKTRRTALTAACLSLTLVAFGCAKDEAAPEFMGRTRISPAMHNDMPGLSYKTRYPHSGFEVQLLQRIKEWLKVPMTGTSDVRSQDRVQLLTDGTADMVLSAFSITTDRMKKIDFVGPYVTTRQGFLVGGKGARIVTRDDLRGTTVCTWEGTTSVEALKELHLGIDPLVLQDVAGCVEELRAGRVDAVTTDQMILYGFADLYDQEGLRVVPDLVVGAPQHYGIGLPKGHREDCERLREYVKSYVGSSEWVDDIRSSLPKLVVAEPEWTNSYRPSDAAIDGRSCRDRPSP